MHQDLTPPPAPPAPPIAAPQYLKVICKDAVWALSIISLLNAKFGYGQIIQHYDAYMEHAEGGFVAFYLNRVTIPMDKIAAMVGSTEEELAKMRSITLNTLPFDPSMPQPTSVWGVA